MAAKFVAEAGRACPMGPAVLVSIAISPRNAAANSSDVARDSGAFRQRDAATFPNARSAIVSPLPATLSLAACLRAIAGKATTAVRIRGDATALSAWRTVPAASPNTIARAARTRILVVRPAPCAFPMAPAWSGYAIAERTTIAVLIRPNALSPFARRMERAASRNRIAVAGTRTLAAPQENSVSPMDGAVAIAAEIPAVAPIGSATQRYATKTEPVAVSSSTAWPEIGQKRVVRQTRLARTMEPAFAIAGEISTAVRRTLESAGTMERVCACAVGGVINPTGVEGPANAGKGTIATRR